MRISNIKDLFSGLLLITIITNHLKICLLRIGDFLNGDKLYTLPRFCALC